MLPAPDSPRTSGPAIGRSGSFVAFLLLALTATGCVHTAQDDMARGERLYRSGKYSDASINFQRAIQKNPNLTDAYLWWGRSELMSQNFTEAWKIWYSASHRFPGDEGIKVELGNLCLGALITDPAKPPNLFQILDQLASALLAANPASFDGLRFKGYLATLNRQPKQAIPYFTRAAELRPGESDVVISLAEALFESGGDPEGERVLRRFIDANKTGSAAYDALYHHYLTLRQLVPAEEVLKLKIANNSGAPHPIIQLCQFYWTNGGNKPEALDLLAKLVSNPARTSESVQEAGDFYASIERWDAAVQQFQEGMRLDSRHKIFFQKRIVNVYLAQGSKDRAAAMLEEILKAVPGDREALKMRGGLRLDWGGPAAIPGAIEDFRRLLRQDDADPSLHYGLGRALLANDEIAAAKTELQRAQSGGSYWPARVALADIALREGQNEEVVRSMTEAAQADPANEQVKLLKAIALQRLGRVSDALDELSSLLMVNPNSAAAYFQTGLIEIARKDYWAADKAFQKAQELTGNSAERTAGQALIYSAQGQMAKAMELVRKEASASRGTPAIHVLVANLATASGQYDTAVAEYRAVLSTGSQSPDEYYRLAHVFELKGDMANSIATLQQACQRYPNDFLPVLLLGVALDTAGQKAAAAQQYHRVLQMQPGEPRALNNLAFQIAETGGNLDEAMDLAHQAVQKQPEELTFQDTLGWIYLKKHLPDSALRVFVGLVKQAPANPTFRYHLGAALIEKGDRPGGRAELEKALAGKPAKQEIDSIRQLLARST